MLYFYVLAQTKLQDRAERGAGMAEYALLLVLVAIALIGGFTALAGGIDGALTRVVNALAAAPVAP